jgi:F-type H+-transporting ATPase subunit delta
MRREKKYKRFARKLQELSMEGDKVSAEKVDGVLAYLSKLPYHKAKPLMKQYFRYIQTVMNKSNAHVEYAGNLNETTRSNLKKQLSEYYKIDVDLNLEEKPELIAGFRVHINNDVWDNTVSHHLQTLAGK